MQQLSSRDNPRVKHAVKLLKSSSYRKKNGQFIAEGLRLCRDAARSGIDIDVLFLTEDALRKHPQDCAGLERSAGETYLVTDRVFSEMSDTRTPQGVLCVLKTLDKTTEFDTIKNGGKFLALDNVQDPSNLGTVLRSAEAFGVTGVILSSDCCDIFNPKVVRGSMGAVFRLPFLICPTIASFLSDHPELHSYAAVVSGDARRVGEFSFETPCVTVVGNEGNGVKEETVSACEKRITIPMSGKAESLNASTAASILIWEMIK